jgi:hypothetical protein
VGQVVRQAIKLQIIKIPSGRGFSQAKAAVPGYLFLFQSAIFPHCYPVAR